MTGIGGRVLGGKVCYSDTLEKFRKRCLDRFSQVFFSSYNGVLIPIVKAMVRMFLLSLILTHAAWGKVISYGDHRFDISYPADWKEVKDFFGIPVTLLGPFQKNDARPVIQIIPTQSAPMKMTQEEMTTFNQNYEAGRKKWVAKNNGKLFEIEKAQLSSDKKGNKILTAGVSYQVNFKSYIEKTFYINCPKKLFNLKIVLNKGNKDFLPKALEIVRSFECGK